MSEVGNPSHEPIHDELTDRGVSGPGVRPDAQLDFWNSRAGDDERRRGANL